MRVLVIATTFAYPPWDGTRIQIYQRVKHLSVTNKVTLLSILDTDPSPAAVAEMEKYAECHFLRRPPIRLSSSAASRVWNFLRSLAGGGPYYWTGIVTGQAKNWIRSRTEAGQFDRIEADEMAGIYLLDRVPAYRVWIMHSVSDSNEKRKLKFIRSPLERCTVRAYAALSSRLERRIALAADLAVTLTDENLRELRLRDPRINGRNCLTNGVDLDYFAFEPPAAVPEGVCFVGKLDHYPNQDAAVNFAAGVWPRIKSIQPSARYYIVGSQPPPPVVELARDPSIVVTGKVEDVRPFLRRAGVAVIPLRMGGGILNKVLEAMALGVPVVARSIATHGLKAKAGEDLFVCDDDTSFAQAVERLLTDPQLRLKMSQNARRYVEQHHQWAALVAEYDSAVRSCMTASSSS